ncbi:DUF397 domain-containing protein [Umezawaea tangerina]|uniref:Uncharacterized protein DUF397 n=1 Tax=Umezawaea tangerina TaxID=84725 RepID=A0A2T0S6Z9_9PSEU|nr:DUF397 domain-containing protein [Umezawaea tangerina]PRY29192.1 uncharacterized protein DUF397 [Umezawaea tangerina]
MNVDAARHPALDTTFAEWRKSSRSNPNGNQCVEVSFSTDAVGVRDSKSPRTEMVVFDHRGWGRFLARLTAGSFRIR